MEYDHHNNLAIFEFHNPCFFPAVFGMPLSEPEPGRPSTNEGKQEDERGVRSKAKAKPKARPVGRSHRDAGGDTGWHISQRRKTKAKQ